MAAAGDARSLEAAFAALKPLAPLLTGELEAIDGGRPTPFEMAMKRQDLALLYRALRALPDDRRELLVLARFHGLNYQQIGEILECEPGTVKGRVFRAMKELGNIYSDLRKEKAS